MIDVINQNNVTALVTGASSGIGRACALALARQGYTVACIGRNEAALTALIEEGVGQLEPFIADLTDVGALPKLIERIRETCGPIGVLVNSAGVIRAGSSDATSPEALTAMLHLNVVVPFTLARLCFSDLVEQRGAVVNVSSVAGLRPFPNLSAYCTSKAALDHQTRCLAIEWAPAGVRVNAVNPGVVVTNLHRRGGMSEAEYAAFLDRTVGAHPLGRVGQPAEIADLVTFLVSAQAGWITGETIAIDGGRHLTAAR